MVPSATNSPWHDLLVGDTKLSIKSETGTITRPTKISITKLCTTETGEWTIPALVEHTVKHIARHDRMLMLRAIWGSLAFRYQLVEVPLPLLRKIRAAKFAEVGTRAGRKSLGADVFEGDKKLFRVHFDGADGKCQIHQLSLEHCASCQWEQALA